MPLPAGTRLGPYEVLGPLGAGGMGEVYRARDSRVRITPDGRSYAYSLMRCTSDLYLVEGLR